MSASWLPGSTPFESVFTRPRPRPDEFAAGNSQCNLPASHTARLCFRMTIDDIVSRLSSAYIPGDWQSFQPALINNRDVAKWSEATGLSRSALYDAIALRLALGFQSKTFEFGFCDQVVNELHAVISVQN